MRYTLLITHKDDSNNLSTFDVSELAHNIEFTTSLDSQPGKLTFTLERDPNQILEISMGSYVHFFSNGNAVFYGRVFSIQTDATEVYKVVAYDAMRYMKNTDAILIEDKTLKEIFEEILNKHNLQTSLGKWADTYNFLPLQSHNFWNESVFNIIQYYIDEETRNNELTYDEKGNVQTVGRRFYMSCRLDKVELREVLYDFFHNDDGSLKDTFLVIGDESLLTDYNYKLDIDDKVYNRLIFVANKEDDNSSLDTGEGNDENTTNTQVTEKQLVAAIDAGWIIKNTRTSLDYTSIGENTLSKWGVLSTVIELKNLSPQNNLEEYMKAAVSVYSQPNRSLKLNAIGYDGVIAGSGFYLHLSKLNINCPVYVISATHKYDADVHTMQLEIATSSTIRKFL